MKFAWFVLFAVAAILMKENSCVPAIRPLSQRGILFPVDSWDDCFLDEASTQPGICKRLEECTDVLKKWNKQNIYPKTCYFIKKLQFVCCPLITEKETFTSTENLENIFNKNTLIPATRPINIFSDIFNTSVEGLFTKNPDATTTPNKRPSNIFLDNIQASSTPTSTKRPSNIFLNNIQATTPTSTKRPSNIFLDNINVEKTTSHKPPPSSFIPDIFNTQKPFLANRRSELECDLQHQRKLAAIDVNGPQAEPDEYPFMAVLGWQSMVDNQVWYPCGGVLVSNRFVLTAAHCADIGGENPSFVHFGDKNLTNSLEGTIKIKQLIVYPGYNVTTIYNDLALVELEEEVNMPMACVWTQHDLPTSQLTALGFGRTSFETLNSNQLFKASLTAFDKEQCQNYYRLDDKLWTMDIVDAHLCAGDVENLHNSCQGDTGGPLIMQMNDKFYVVGITSYGLGCADLPPSIYTRVSAFTDWIEQIVWPKIDIRFNRK